eukprot:CAMPEP_0184709172 /NCGR_PEP_ID=MMETSP0314-20130426/387_1 /TAXON_ID=38298 /ORGANISM="Rhodella maculata, Strain CCMP 736" /LENGTH=102 /DNA_ID=CAMNT_0027170835 /DNA_START=9 /DNA_END=315 /DNA_ORIENTATION=-
MNAPNSLSGSACAPSTAEPASTNSPPTACPPIASIFFSIVLVISTFPPSAIVYTLVTTFTATPFAILTFTESPHPLAPSGTSNSTFSFINSCKSPPPPPPPP